MPVCAALAADGIPFIPGELVKIMISIYIGPKIPNRLIKGDL